VTGNPDKELYEKVLRYIDNIEERIVELYRESHERILEKLAKFRQDAEAGMIPPAFERARLNEMLMQIEAEANALQTRLYSEVQTSFADIYGGTYYESAYNYERAVNQLGMNESYTLNYPALNTQAVKASFDERVAGMTFLDRIERDAVVMRFRLQEAVSRTIIEGQTVEALKKRLALLDDVYAMNEAKATMTARTELLRAYSLGHEQASQAATEAGVEFEYIWDAALDGRTRPEHRAADGKRATIIDGLPAFSVGGCLFSSPRVLHPNNQGLKTAAQIVNCRCRRVDAPFGITPTERTAKTPGGAWKRVPYNTSAQEWYDAHYGGELPF
jgi:SPP1 gp7 family putative phage head morphogenesis protein